VRSGASGRCSRASSARAAAGAVSAERFAGSSRSSGGRGLSAAAAGAAAGRGLSASAKAPADGAPVVLSFARSDTAAFDSLARDFRGLRETGASTEAAVRLRATRAYKDALKAQRDDERRQEYLVSELGAALRAITGDADGLTTALPNLRSAIAAPFLVVVSRATTAVHPPCSRRGTLLDGANAVMLA